MTGNPDFFSSSDRCGRDDSTITLPDSGPYYLLARQAFGGPAGGDELYGKLQARGWWSHGGDRFNEDKKEVMIHVAPKSSE